MYDYNSDAWEGYAETDYLAHWPDEAYLPVPEPDTTAPF